jgi:hypothetical protein
MKRYKVFFDEEYMKFVCDLTGCHHKKCPGYISVIFSNIYLNQ